MSNNPDLLHPPQRNNNPNPDHIIPLTPQVRPPFSHYQSSSTLPITPQTPYSPQRTTSTTLEKSTELKSYLSLPPRILLTFLSPCLLPIILTISHMINNRQSTASLAISLKESMFAACNGLAKGAASIQTMPRYLAIQTNQEVIRATQASILTIGNLLMDSVTTIEVVVEFIVDTYRSMLLCTIELAIRGTLEIVIGAVEVITEGITTSLNKIRDEIQSDISSANNLIQSAVSGINSVTSLVNVNLSVPEFSIPSLDFLANVTVPTTFEDSLIKLNSSLPTLNELKNKMNEIIEIPFETLKKEINETRLEIAANFNSSLLPVPALSALSSNKANDLQNDLCTDLDTSLIDDTAKALHKLSNTAIGLMFLLLFCIWITLIIWEWRKWRTMKNTVEVVEDEWRREGKIDAWRIVSIVEHPILEKYSSGILSRLTRSNRTRTNLRWFLSYLSHPTCLSLLFISLLGFLSIQFQLVALNALKAHARENANSTVAASTNSLTTKLNAVAMQSSEEYADQYNAAIATYQKRIDDELFGSWLNTTAITLNTTLVEFYNEVEQVLNTTFGGTILFNPINNFMYCILGSKINNLEKGLTWISEHAHIELPTLPSNILILSNQSMNEITTPIAAAAIGSSSSSNEDKDEGVVGKLINHFENTLKAERMFYGIMIIMWCILFLIGLIIDTYTEKEYKGIKKIEPKINIANSNEKSFFEYPINQNESIRPFNSRKNTLGSTISSLAIPGQIFLKITGRKLSSNSKDQNQNQNQNQQYDDEKLINGNINSENYNYHSYDFIKKQNQKDKKDLKEQSNFWVNKFYGNFSTENLKSILPTKSFKNDESLLKRNEKTKTENSFEPNQIPSNSFSSNGELNELNQFNSNKNIIQGEWTMNNPQFIGRNLNELNDINNNNQGRYPLFNEKNQNQNQMIYPRPMSRASTIQVIEEVKILPKFNNHSFENQNPFNDQLPPPLPSKFDLYKEKEKEEEKLKSIISPCSIISSSSSSNKSYFAFEPKVQIVNKVQINSNSEYGKGKGTIALAGILEELKEKKREYKKEEDLENIFDDSREIL
ncbi:uncharacterized protein I206_106847 [Kwoniella pini CBS 10737]|uniref:Plasma membrane fusion protein PRM1 n=1 Tax=Kwoniella pini CBS 10737 TaxID=1296096 RepID=A0A1B9HZW6_9TREE|nr:uncharacterized protein I206_05607 [Kwoniella pini CBS 10737]OCF48826.1 hypothetical protein I206_05607 [Kwoniella pini CBS 10737]